MGIKFILPKRFHFFVLVHYFARKWKLSSCNSLPPPKKRRGEGISAYKKLAVLVQNGRLDFLWRRVIPITVDWYEKRNCKNNNK